MDVLCSLFIDVLWCLEAVSLLVVSPFLASGVAVVGAAAPPPESVPAFARSYFLFFKALSLFFGAVWWPEA